MSDIGIFAEIGGAWLLGFATHRRVEDISQVRVRAARIHRSEPHSVVSSSKGFVQQKYSRHNPK